MDAMIAYCGLDCSGCSIHRATLVEDISAQRSMREDIARICRQQYGMEVQPADVTDCDGCRSQTGRLFSGCARCEIRTCVIGRSLASCAYCAEYACETLQKFFETDPAARVRLEEMRNGS